LNFDITKHNQNNNCIGGILQIFFIIKRFVPRKREEICAQDPTATSPTHQRQPH